MAEKVDLFIDREMLLAFERQLDPRRPEAGELGARVLGYGEISTVFEIGRSSSADVAYKRMPIFESDSELDSYRFIYREYNRLLTEEVGLSLPSWGCESVRDDGGRPVMFLAQRKLDPRSICNRVIHDVPDDDACMLVRSVMRELAKVWEFNISQAETELGIDGQVSNWAVEGFDPGAGRLEDGFKLLYLDTSTPFVRLGGIEQLDPELFLRSAPSFMVWLLRALFLEDVITRYYDFHLVATDLVANFHKEQLSGLIPRLVEEANDFFENEAPQLGVEPLSEKEVRSYYREDAIIWRLYLSMRKADRFLKTRLSRKGYPYILPGKIKR